jgi:ABC-type glycerol-3-phosphate transport system permease component
MMALFGGIIVLLSAYSLSWEFTFGSFLWLILVILLCIPNFIHLIVVDRFNGNKRK